MVRKILLSVISAVALCAMGFAQNRPVSGVVTNEDGSPMLGVVVTVQGTTTSSLTDAAGRYTISAPSSGNLEFTSFGMESVLMPIQGRSVVDAVMIPNATSIDDVIVIAYGLATREAFTGSASTLGSGDITKRQVSNVTKALSGAVAGVQAYSNSGQPGSSANIRIRGIGSMSSSNAPLFVLDGMPFQGDMSSISPQDIESITVLKDASAAAIYGARGANGVILINTKKGKSREAVVTVDAKWGSNKRGVPQYDVMTDPAMYFETLYQSLHNSYMSNPALNLTPTEMNIMSNGRLFGQDGGTGYQVYTVPTGQQLIGMNGKLNPNAVLGYNNGKNVFMPDDWYRESFGKGSLRQEYTVSISGSDEKFNYFLSGGYLNDSGFIPNSDFERFTTRIRAEYQVKKWLRTTANISYTNSIQNSPGDQSGNSSGNIFFMSNYISPAYPFYVRDAEGNIMVDGNGLTVYDFGDGKQNGVSRTFMPGANPYASVALNYSRYKMDILGARWGVVADIIDGLKLQANVGMDLDITDWTRQDNKWYGQYQPMGGYIYKSRSRQFAMTQQYLLSYNRKWGDHNFDILGGYENYRLDISSLNGSRENIYNPDNHELNNAILNHKAYSSRDRYAVIGFLGRAQYDYANKYFVSASYRRDASSRFHPDNRWGDFGSIGGAWVVSNEDFFNVPLFDMLKLKASWGVQGNDALLYPNGYANYYPYSDQYDLTESDGAFSTTLRDKGNVDITWETSYNFNAGVEFDMFDSRFGGNIEFFNRKTGDLLYNKPVSPSGGFTTFPMNLGAIRNSGVEIDLYGTIIQNQNFMWSVNANGTFLKNKILELAENEIINGSWRYTPGGSLYNMYIREYAGVAQEDFSGKDALGRDKKWEAGEALYWMRLEKADAPGEYHEQELTQNWSLAEQRDTGSILPRFSGGFGTTLYLYGFDLSAQFAYQIGGKAYDNTYSALMHDGGSLGQNWHMDMLGAWTPDNKSENTPRLDFDDSYTNSVSTRFLISSDYLSINNITIGYTIPERLTKRIDVSSVRVYFSADNLAVFSHRRGLDPRQILAGATSSQTYSAIRSLNGGITFSF